MAAAQRNRDARFMTLILLEALGALLLLLLIVWWTMFAGRRKGELPPHRREGADEHGADQAPPPER
jgi:hypothetical protein